MILRETSLYECWCEKCNNGLMQEVFDKANVEGKHVSEFIGHIIVCTKCLHENKIEDYLLIIPNTFMISSKFVDSITKSIININDNRTSL